MTSESHDKFLEDSVKVTLKDEYALLLRFITHHRDTGAQLGRIMLSGAILDVLFNYISKNIMLGNTKWDTTKLCIYIFPVKPICKSLTQHLVVWFSHWVGIYVSAVYNKEGRIVKLCFKRKHISRANLIIAALWNNSNTNRSEDARESEML